MDNTETYIKMCGCVEIQGQKPVTEDRVGSTYYGWYGIKLSNKKLYSTNRPNGVIDSIWLPRQDQLQEMLSGIKDRKTGLRLRLVTAFYVWLKEGETGEGDDLYFASRELDYNSMEQLWLAFVMKEKHNKVWVNNKWEVINV